MKSTKWIIITSTVIAVVVWLCHFLFAYRYGEALIIVTSNGLALAVSATIGYTMISFLEKKETYNMFTAILMPCMPVFALCLLVACFVSILGFVLIALSPFLLIASSVGGVLGHKKRLRQHAKTLK